MCLSSLEQQPINEKVVGSMPGQGTHLGCRFSPRSGYIQEATDQCFSLMLMFSFLSHSLPYTADILRISKSIKLLVKIKNVSSLLQKKLNGLFGQPNSSFEKECKSWTLHFSLSRALLCFKHHTSSHENLRCRFAPAPIPHPHCTLPGLSRVRVTSPCHRMSP